jgi:hypothetical protein
MTRRIQEPTVAQGKFGGLDETTVTHPAFAQILASRVSGSAVLYGSDFEHQHFVMVRIARSEIHRTLSEDRHYGREEYIEVALSEAQWATFVSSMNVGSGVPCTLTYKQGEGLIPGLPPRRQEDEVHADFQRVAQRAAARVDKAIADINGELGAGLSQKKRDAILEHLKWLKKDLDDSMPFIAKQFGEHMETTVERAKVEVAAYATATIQRAGLAALAGDTPVLRLAAGKNDVIDGEFEVDSGAEPEA